MIAELRKYTPMFALVHARSKAPNEKVVGSPILEFAQSASVRNAVAAMKRSGRTAETQKRPIATTSGDECRRDRRRGACTGILVMASVTLNALHG
jgi:hypothetical protein